MFLCPSLRQTAARLSLSGSFSTLLESGLAACTSSVKSLFLMLLSNFPLVHVPFLLFMFNVVLERDDIHLSTADYIYSSKFNGLSGLDLHCITHFVISLPF